jgi:UDP-N-acetylglucosamine--dolichyl-phosphate N-acetylglucosaminephosphotransferase
MTVSTELTRTESYSLLALSVVCLGILVNTFQGDGYALTADIALSGLAFALTFALIRWSQNVFMKAGFKGKDMSKTKKNEMYVFSVA